MYNEGRLGGYEGLRPFHFAHTFGDDDSLLGHDGVFTSGDSDLGSLLAGIKYHDGVVPLLAGHITIADAIGHTVGRRGKDEDCRAPSRPCRDGKSDVLCGAG